MLMSTGSSTTRRHSGSACTLLGWLVARFVQVAVAVVLFLSSVAPDVVYTDLAGLLRGSGVSWLHGLGAALTQVRISDLTSRLQLFGLGVLWTSGSFGGLYRFWGLRGHPARAQPRAWTDPDGNVWVRRLPFGFGGPSMTHPECGQHRRRLAIRLPGERTARLLRQQDTPSDGEIWCPSLHTVPWFSYAATFEQAQLQADAEIRETIDLGQA
jgi:hypothetical protein